MSLLTPLYALGILAVSLPIIFHLIQRRPKGETTFSSLMFLKPSPPRLTRRSRLDNILLLILRGLALTLLALAFARPFLRSLTQLGFDGDSQTVLVLLDTSASMQREDLWAQAVKHVTDLADELGDRDRIALVRFDQKPQTVVGFPAADDASDQRQTIRAALQSLQPSWHSTSLDAALMAACDRLRADEQNRDHGENRIARIVLISDFQKGSQLAALNAFSWPEEVQLDCRPVRAKIPGNAFLQVLEETEGELSSDELRIRVENTPDAKTEQFQLAWTSQNQATVGKPISVHVPSGQSRTLSLAPRNTSTCLRLLNDPHDFDNDKFIARPNPVTRELVYFGAAGDNQGLFYYLKQIDLNSNRRIVKIVVRPWDSNIVLSPRFIPLVVFGKDLTSAAAMKLKAYLQAGGKVLAVLADSQPMAEDELAAWRTLTGLDAFQVEPIASDDYAMLTKIDFQHSLFVAFADPRFNDFTKIRFWKHRKIGASHEAPWRILARFDDDFPALVEKEIGEGTIWIMTSGWHTEDSQFARSSKFVPIIGTMFDLGDNTNEFDVNYAVGASIDSRVWQANQVIRPDGRIAKIASDAPFSDANQPGIYAFMTGPEQRSVSVNLDAAESVTDPLDLSEFEERGIQLGRQQSYEERKQKERQMRDVELESQQTLWRYLLIFAVMILGLETWLAGRSKKTNLPAT